jgi:hypothetical protein
MSESDSEFKSGGGARKNFSKVEDVLKKLLNVRRYVWETLKSGRVPDLFFPSYDRFFN